ncbi:MAG: PQQ-binding-like beta-propeller repeat protein [Phocaeicola sp.]
MLQLRKCLLLTAFTTISACAFAQSRGVVFEDRNGNGIREAGERLLSGVIVSDGKNCVSTDKNGNYELPSNKGTKFIFVSTPDGYTYHETFYYRYSSERTIYNFPLRKVKNESNQFVQVSDPETYNHHDWMEDLKRYVKNNQPAFIVSTGDICYEKGIKFHGENFTDQSMGTRVVMTLGNHDLVGENGKGELLYEENFGPVWYSFNVGGVHFVVTPMEGGDRRPSYTLDELLHWLKQDLDLVGKEKPIVLFNHDIVFDKGDYTYKTKSTEFSLNDYNLVGWLYGHWHVNLFKQFGKTKTYGTSSPDKGGIDFSPSCFRVLSFDKEKGLESELRYTSVRNHAVANLANDGRVVANVYSTDNYVESVWLKSDQKSYRLKQDSDWAWSLQATSSLDWKNATIESHFFDGMVQKNTIGVGNSLQSPPLLWASSLAANCFMASPVYENGVVYSATYDDDSATKCGVTAFNGATGRKLWMCQTENSVKNNFASDEEYLYVCDLGGVLYKIEKQSGKIVSRLALHNYILPTHNLGILLEDGVVYAGHGSSLSAVKAADFSILWTTNAKTGGEGTNLTITKKDDLIFSGGFWRGRFCYSATNGDLMWQMSDNGANFCASAAVPWGNLLYFISSNYIHEVDARSGKTLRLAAHTQTQTTASCPIVTDELIIFGGDKDGMIAFDRKSLKQKWVFQCRPALVYTTSYAQNYEKTVESSPVLYKGVLYFGASDGYLYALDGVTGTFQWSYNLGAPILSGVTIDETNDELYVNDMGGTLYKFKL